MARGHCFGSRRFRSAVRTRLSPGATLAGACAALLFVVGCSPSGAPPYAFESLPEQRFRLRANEAMTIDGEEIKIEKAADARVVLETFEDGKAELVVYLERYYLHVVGGPAGESELSLSEAGLVSRGGEAGEVLVAPDQALGDGDTLREILDRPLGGFFIDAAGKAGAPWRSYHPLLQNIHVGDWILFGLPALGGVSEDVWDGARQIPAIGRYDLGIQIPLRFQSQSEGEGRRIRSSGVAQREQIRIAPGLEGKIQLESTGDSLLDPRGRLLEATIELRMGFAGNTGTRVDSLHRLRVACRNCGEPPDPETEPGGDLGLEPPESGPPTVVQ